MGWGDVGWSVLVWRGTQMTITVGDAMMHMWGGVDDAGEA